MLFIWQLELQAELLPLSHRPLPLPQLRVEQRLFNAQIHWLIRRIQLVCMCSPAGVETAQAGQVLLSNRFFQLLLNLTNEIRVVQVTVADSTHRILLVRTRRPWLSLILLLVSLLRDEIDALRLCSELAFLRSAACILIHAWLLLLVAQSCRHFVLVSVCTAKLVLV